MDLQIGRGGGPRRRRTRRSDAGCIQLQGLVRVPGRVVDFLDVARRECVAVIRSFLIEWRLNVHLRHFRRKDASKTAIRLEMREKPPLDLKRCRGNARKAATCLWVLSFWCHAVDAHRSLRRLLARYAVPWRVRNHDAVVACEITTHSPWCRRMKKGARANMTRTPIKTRCSVALHCGPRLKQDETLGERHSHTRLYAASSNCELYSSA